ncbi:MAG: HAMP domain-containing protein [Anaerolineales bacterium]|nr:HAMP domain-containing protein [Anaerolineales bacterium]
MCSDESKPPAQADEGAWSPPPWGGHGPPWGEPGFEGPPWGWQARQQRHEMRKHWRRRPGWVFLRFAMVFGVITLLLMGAIALFIFLLVGVADGNKQRATALWLGTCGLLLFLPMLAGFLSRRAYRSIARPLSGMMVAADRVAAGDFSVRVEGSPRGDFSRLTDSFNHMVEELQVADQRRRNLTADVAHELRTPLQIIQGNLEGVIDGGLRADAGAYRSHAGRDPAAGATGGGSARALAGRGGATGDERGAGGYRRVGSRCGDEL